MHSPAEDFWKELEGYSSSQATDYPFKLGPIHEIETEWQEDLVTDNSLDAPEIPQLSQPAHEIIHPEDSFNVPFDIEPIEPVLNTVMVPSIAMSGLGHGPQFTPLTSPTSNPPTPLPLRHRLLSSLALVDLHMLQIEDTVNPKVLQEKARLRSVIRKEKSAHRKLASVGTRPADDGLEPELLRGSIVDVLKNDIDKAPRRRKRTKLEPALVPPAVELVKPFKCSDCSKAFKRQEHLKRHNRLVHSTERPFGCDLCEKKFSRGDNLAQHLRTHKR